MTSTCDIYLFTPQQAYARYFTHVQITGPRSNCYHLNFNSYLKLGLDIIIIMWEFSASSLLFACCSGPNVCGFSKFVCWHFYPQCLVSGHGVFGENLGHERDSLMNEVSIVSPTWTEKKKDPSMTAACSCGDTEITGARACKTRRVSNCSTQLHLQDTGSPRLPAPSDSGPAIPPPLCKFPLSCPMLGQVLLSLLTCLHPG